MLEGFRVLQGQQIVRYAWQTIGLAPTVHSTSLAPASTWLPNAVDNFSVSSAQLEQPELMEDFARAV